MTNNIPPLVAPSSRSWLGIAREATTGTPVLPVSTIPLNKSTYEPEDQPKFLEDLAIRGSMSHRFADILGVEDANFSYGGPVFGDVWGYWLDNVFGDLSTTGSSPASSTTTTEAVATGVTSVTVAAITGYSLGSVVQIDSGAIAEVVVLSSAPSELTLTFAGSPLRFAHTTAATVAIVEAPFTHVFAVLNQSASVGGINGAQAPTHTASDWTSLTETVGARSYPSLRIGSLDFTGNAEALWMGKCTGNSWISAPATEAPTNTTTFTTPLPVWNSTVTVGDTEYFFNAEWAVNVKRELGVMWTAQGAQNPYVIAQGDLDASGSLKVSVPSDETALLWMLDNTQPSLSIAITNGLTGADEISCTFATTYMDVVKAKPTRSGVLIGYDLEWRTHANTTDVGGSAGLGQMTISLTNATPTY